MIKLQHDLKRTGPDEFELVLTEVNAGFTNKRATFYLSLMELRDVHRSMDIEIQEAMRGDMDEDSLSERAEAGDALRF